MSASDAEPPSPWAAPAEQPDFPPAHLGPELVFKLPGHLYRREYRAFLRTMRWWLSPVALVVGAGLVLAGAALLLVGLRWDSIITGLVGVMIVAVGVNPWIAPFSLSRLAWKAVRDGPPVRLHIVGAEIRVSGRDALALPVRDVTSVRRRRGLRWLVLGKRFAVFVPDKPITGDPESFLEALEVAKSAQQPAWVRPEGPFIAVKPPSMLSHLGRVYRLLIVSWRLWVFVAAVTVVCGALTCFFGAAGQWVATVLTACIPAAVLGPFALFPVIAVVLRGREALGEPGTQTVFVATEEGLLARGPFAQSHVGWERVTSARWVGGMIVVKMGARSIFLARADVVDGDIDALSEAFERHIG